MRFFKTIKFRLATWYIATIVLLLTVYGIGAYFLLANNLYQTLDDSIRARTIELLGSIQSQNGSITFGTPLGEMVLVYDSKAKLVQEIGPNIEFATIGTAIEEALVGRSSFVTTSTDEGHEVRLYVTPFTVESSRIAVIVGRSTSEIRDVLGGFKIIIVISSLSMVILGSAAGFILARRALKPVDRMTKTAQEIEETDLSRRIVVTGEDEMGRLAATLNQMIERLESAFERERQFTGDASHELRTPLAVIEAEATLALSREREPAEYRKSLELVSREASIMSAMTSKLLFLARSDAQKSPPTFHPVNLKRLISELSADVELLARDKGLQFDLGPLEDLTVSGDRVRLRQLFFNLLENAVRYTSSPGNVTASLVQKEQSAVVAISDSGTGIPPEHIPHIFKRFYRTDKARSREQGGVGLGLAIAQRIAQVHGGKIDVESEVDRGSTFLVTIPLMAPDATLAA